MYEISIWFTIGCTNLGARRRNLHTGCGDLLRLDEEALREINLECYL